MSLMALLNAVHTYGISICGVTSVTSKKQKLTLFSLIMLFIQNTAICLPILPYGLWLIKEAPNFCGSYLGTLME